MEVLNQFGINPILLAAQVVNFLILLWLLNKFLYKPIIRVLEERKQKVAEANKNAEEIEKKLLQITALKEEEILKAVKEGEKIIKEASDEALQIIENGRRQYEEIIKNARKDAKELLQVEKANLDREIRENLGEMIALALQKVTGKVLSKKDQQNILEKEIRNLS
ncbi:hypothetical protein HYS96_03120 [Candidatus Daviesbacteria bacterium]|nr:hypothetical protein [Candidatus Daviesbacteria bacterium]